ncbi:MAG: translation elongation factor 4, partial [Defluviitaleaceae bacterium]|nr:translation elongation factor 4 [Defluviitaleaceae bacterium]
YKGVIVFIRVFDGSFGKGDRIRLLGTAKEFEVTEAGIFRPGRFMPTGKLTAGEVGYFCASIKNVADTQIGDTVTLAANPTTEQFPGFKPAMPMVYCGVFPSDRSKYTDLRDALDKMKLNDAALYFEPEVSIALGFGFRCGFLGLLHLEIITERLEREFDLELITTAPSVIYKIYKTDGTMLELSNPANYPDPSQIERTEEPVVKAEILLPTEYIGPIMELCQNRRGEYLGVEYIDSTRAKMFYELPLNEIIYDFFDALKSRSRGYASFDYELSEYKTSNLVKLDILLNHDMLDALSFIVFAGSAQERGRKMVEKLKKEIPRHMFEIPIQAAIGSKIVARETISAMRKDVTAKCYGGDITRKKKLLEKQKEGKKKMRNIGSVELPQSAFLSVLKLDEE